MGVLTEFQNALLGLVKAAPQVNRDQRRQIRDVIGELADEMDRSLSLASSYIDGAKSIRDRQQLSEYLRNAGGKLMNTYSEYKICANLYDLHDRFNQVFDPARFAVSIGSGQEVRNLLNSLGNGERMVIDDLDQMIHRLSRAADDLDAAVTPEEEAGARNQVKVLIETENEALQQHRATIRTTMRSAFKVI